jgi:hypothetical protein
MTTPTPAGLRFAAVLALALVSPAAAAGKKKKKGGDAPAAASGPAASDMKIPDDGDSRKFAEALLETTITGFRPSDSGGGKFEYNTLSFSADNTWKADGYVEIMDERMECTESGTWEMEPAESAKTATVAWTVAQTDCPSRESGTSLRVVMTLGKNGVEDLKFR